MGLRRQFLRLVTDMDYFFSPSTAGFFISGINTSVPSDAIKIEYELYRELALMPRQSGEVIVIDKGTSLPMLSVQPSPWHCWDGEKWGNRVPLVHMFPAHTRDRRA